MLAVGSILSATIGWESIPVIDRAAKQIEGVERRCSFHLAAGSRSPQTPQRDLVEMLVFTLSDTVSRSQVDEHVERHRTRLESAAATAIKNDDWTEGFRCEVFLEAINRVPLQWVFHSRFPSGYAVRISRTLEHLLSLYADV